MVERRGINRVDYRVKSVIVTCDTFEKFVVEAVNVSPLGMGVLVDKGAPELLNKDIIIVADCLVMYAHVNRIADYDETHNIVGINGKTFDDATLGYLFEHIG